MTTLVTVLGAALALGGCGVLGSDDTAPSVEARRDARQDDARDRADDAPAGGDLAAQTSQSDQETHDQTADGPDAEPEDFGSSVASESTDDDGPWAETSAPVATFLMPSMNVACAMADDWAACEILNRDYVPQAGDVAYECPPVRANTILLTDTGPGEWICSDRSLFGLSAESETVAEYGEMWQVGQFGCLSDSDGVVCTSPNGSSFRMAREDYDLG